MHFCSGLIFIRHSLLNSATSISSLLFFTDDKDRAVRVLVERGALDLELGAGTIVVGYWFAFDPVSPS
jgi:hypothetical protein